MSNSVEMVFVLDRSGSMHGTEADVVGGFNSMIEKQREEGGKVLVSTVLFSYGSEVLHDRVDVREIPTMKKEDFVTGGGTALLDAIGDAVHHIKNVHKYARQEDRPAHTLFVVMTDGEENSSTQYSSEQIKALVGEMKEKNNWEFIFVGSDIDEITAAQSVGIGAARSVHFSRDVDDYECCFDAVGGVVSELKRMEPSACMDDDAFADIFSIFKKK